jgi:hypothetical protein
VDRNERMRREKRPGITFKVTPHSDPFSLTWPHLLSFPEYPKIALPSGDQVFSAMNL